MSKFGAIKTRTLVVLAALFAAVALTGAGCIGSSPQLPNTQSESGVAIVTPTAQGV